MASARLRASVGTACADFHWFMPALRPCQITPWVSHSMHVAVRHAHGLDQLGAGDAGGPGAVDHEPGLGPASGR